MTYKINRYEYFLRKSLALLNSLKGYLYKIAVDLNILKIPNLNNRPGEGIVVSLTSYGRRVKNTIVYYTLVSLLRQNRQPTKIVLWLAEDEWTDDSIPPRLYKLKEKGVEICYCKDIKSYKKLVPTLKKYPTSTIVTVDDDMIYSSDTIETLIAAHERMPNEIICTVARKPIIEKGLPKKYNEWEDSQISPFDDNSQGVNLFPVGVGGVLYPVGSLHDDVVKEYLFMKYCPLADDIWFWFCGWRKHTVKRFVKKRGNDYSFDSLYQYFHKGSALTHANSQEDQNDVQLKELFRCYNIREIEN